MGGGAFLEPLHPLFQMQGYEQGRVPALSPNVHVADRLLKVSETRIDSFLQRLDAHTQGFQVRRHQVPQQLAGIVNRTQGA